VVYSMDFILIDITGMCRLFSGTSLL